MAVLHEVRVILEVVVLAMFEDEDAILLQQSVLEDERRNLFQVRQGIGRVGKDEVELFVATLDEAEHIAADGDALVGLYLFHYLADERMVLRVFLYRNHLVATPRHQLDADAPRS